MSVVLFVRIKSDLEFDEIERRIIERKPNFLEIPGLIQKIFGYDPATTPFGGGHLFRIIRPTKRRFVDHFYQISVRSR